MSRESRVDDRIDALFRLPLTEFIGARDTLAAQLRKDKEATAAGRVKALVKPNLPAWVVNQLYWQHRDDFDDLLASGARLRALQQHGLAGSNGGGSGELQTETDEKRRVLTGLIRRAELVLAADGRSPAPATLKRVETTLEALAALGGTGPDARPGRLARDLALPGFDALLTLAATAPPARQPPRTKKPRPMERAGSEATVLTEPPANTSTSAGAKRQVPSATPDREAIRRVQAAVEWLDRCREAAGEAEASRAAAAARVRQTVAEVARAQRHLTQAEKHAERAAVNLERAKTRKESAEDDARQAEDSLSAARAAAARARGL